MANVITGLRILVSEVLVFCPVFSQIFYVLYLIAGLSDMVDGIIARKTNSFSEFGSRFDGVADFVFVAVCLIKILPVIDISVWLYAYQALGCVHAEKIIPWIADEEPFDVQLEYVL